ncbi:hypothetical protein M8J76_008940 [Diaphorina citri]|nr:hypothetical protein M8J76_008940 [Diaphorina citri]
MDRVLPSSLTDVSISDIVQPGLGTQCIELENIQPNKCVVSKILPAILQCSLNTEYNFTEWLNCIELEPDSEYYEGFINHLEGQIGTIPIDHPSWSPLVKTVIRLSGSSILQKEKFVSIIKIFQSGLTSSNHNIRFITWSHWLYLSQHTLHLLSTATYSPLIMKLLVLPLNKVAHQLPSESAELIQLKIEIVKEFLKTCAPLNFDASYRIIETTMKLFYTGNISSLKYEPDICYNITEVYLDMLQHSEASSCTVLLTNGLDKVIACLLHSMSHSERRDELLLRVWQKTCHHFKDIRCPTLFMDTIRSEMVTLYTSFSPLLSSACPSSPGSTVNRDFIPMKLLLALDLTWDGDAGRTLGNVPWDVVLRMVQMYLAEHEMTKYHVLLFPMLMRGDLLATEDKAVLTTLVQLKNQFPAEFITTSLFKSCLDLLQQGAQQGYQGSVLFTEIWMLLITYYTELVSDGVVKINDVPNEYEGVNFSIPHRLLLLPLVTRINWSEKLSKVWKKMYSSLVTTAALELTGRDSLFSEMLLDELRAPADSKKGPPGPQESEALVHILFLMLLNNQTSGFNQSISSGKLTLVFKQCQEFLISLVGCTHSRAILDLIVNLCTSNATRGILISPVVNELSARITSDSTLLDLALTTKIIKLQRDMKQFRQSVSKSGSAGSKSVLSAAPSPRTSSRFLDKLSQQQQQGSLSKVTPPSSTTVTPNKKDKSKLNTSVHEEGDTQDYVFIAPSAESMVIPLTQHQKEKLRSRPENIPALYQDLSQSSMNSQNSQDCIVLTAGHPVDCEGLDIDMVGTKKGNAGLNKMDIDNTTGKANKKESAARTVPAALDMDENASDVFSLDAPPVEETLNEINIENQINRLREDLVPLRKTKAGGDLKEAGKEPVPPRKIKASADFKEGGNEELVTLNDENQMLKVSAKKSAESARTDEVPRKSRRRDSDSERSDRDHSDESRKSTKLIPIDEREVPRTRKSLGKLKENEAKSESPNRRKQSFSDKRNDSEGIERGRKQLRSEELRSEAGKRRNDSEERERDQSPRRQLIGGSESPSKRKKLLKRNAQEERPEEDSKRKRVEETAKGDRNGKEKEDKSEKEKDVDKNGKEKEVDKTGKEADKNGKISKASNETADRKEELKTPTRRQSERKCSSPFNTKDFIVDLPTRRKSAPALAMPSKAVNTAAEDAEMDAPKAEEEVEDVNVAKGKGDARRKSAPTETLLNESDKQTNVEEEVEEVNVAKGKGYARKKSAPTEALPNESDDKQTRSDENVKNDEVNVTKTKGDARRKSAPTETCPDESDKTRSSDENVKEDEASQTNEQTEKKERPTRKSILKASKVQTQVEESSEANEATDESSAGEDFAAPRAMGKKARNPRKSILKGPKQSVEPPMTRKSVKFNAKLLLSNTLEEGNDGKDDKDHGKDNKDHGKDDKDHGKGDKDHGKDDKDEQKNEPNKDEHESDPTVSVDKEENADKGEDEVKPVKKKEENVNPSEDREKVVELKEEENKSSDLNKTTEFMEVDTQGLDSIKETIGDNDGDFGSTHEGKQVKEESGDQSRGIPSGNNIQTEDKHDNPKPNNNPNATEANPNAREAITQKSTSTTQPITPQSPQPSTHLALPKHDKQDVNKSKRKSNVSRIELDIRKKTIQQIYENIHLYRSNEVIFDMDSVCVNDKPLVYENFKTQILYNNLKFLLTEHAIYGVTDASLNAAFGPNAGLHQNNMTVGAQHCTLAGNQTTLGMTHLGNENLHKTGYYGNETTRFLPNETTRFGFQGNETNASFGITLNKTGVPMYRLVNGDTKIGSKHLNHMIVTKNSGTKSFHFISSFSFVLLGQPVTLPIEEMNISHLWSGETLSEMLDCFRGLTSVNLFLITVLTEQKQLIDKRFKTKLADKLLGLSKGMGSGYWVKYLDYTTWAFKEHVPPEFNIYEEDSTLVRIENVKFNFYVNEPTDSTDELADNKLTSNGEIEKDMLSRIEKDTTQVTSREKSEQDNPKQTSETQRESSEHRKHGAEKATCKTNVDKVDKAVAGKDVCKADVKDVESQSKEDEKMETEDREDRITESKETCREQKETREEVEEKISKVKADASILNASTSFMIPDTQQNDVHMKQNEVTPQQNNATPQQNDGKDLSSEPSSLEVIESSQESSLVDLKSPKPHSTKFVTSTPFACRLAKEPTSKSGESGLSGLSGSSRSVDTLERPVLESDTDSPRRNIGPAGKLDSPRVSRIFPPVQGKVKVGGEEHSSLPHAVSTPRPGKGKFGGEEHASPPEAVSTPRRGEQSPRKAMVSSEERRQAMGLFGGKKTTPPQQSALGGRGAAMLELLESGGSRLVKKRVTPTRLSLPSSSTPSPTMESPKSSRRSSRMISLVKSCPEEEEPSRVGGASGTPTETRWRHEHPWTPHRTPTTGGILRVFSSGKKKLKVNFMENPVSSELHFDSTKETLNNSRHILYNQPGSSPLVGKKLQFDSGDDGPKERLDLGATEDRIKSIKASLNELNESLRKSQAARSQDKESQDKESQDNKSQASTSQDKKSQVNKPQDSTSKESLSKAPQERESGAKTASPFKGSANAHGESPSDAKPRESQPTNAIFGGTEERTESMGRHEERAATEGVRSEESSRTPMGKGRVSQIPAGVDCQVALEDVAVPAVREFRRSRNVETPDRELGRDSTLKTPDRELAAKTVKYERNASHRETNPAVECETDNGSQASNNSTFEKHHDTASYVEPSVLETLQGTLETDAQRLQSLVNSIEDEYDEEFDSLVDEIEEIMDSQERMDKTREVTLNETYTIDKDEDSELADEENPVADSLVDDSNGIDNAKDSKLNANKVEDSARDSQIVIGNSQPLATSIPDELAHNLDAISSQPTVLLDQMTEDEINFRPVKRRRSRRFGLNRTNSFGHGFGQEEACRSLEQLTSSVPVIDMGSDVAVVGDRVGDKAEVEVGVTPTNNVAPEVEGPITETTLGSSKDTPVDRLQPTPTVEDSLAVSGDGKTQHTPPSTPTKSRTGASPLRRSLRSLTNTPPKNDQQSHINKGLLRSLTNTPPKNDQPIDKGLSPLKTSSASSEKEAKVSTPKSKCAARDLSGDIAVKSFKTDPHASPAKGMESQSQGTPSKGAPEGAFLTPSKSTPSGGIFFKATPPKGTPSKGTPSKGTPSKGTPSKGTPSKALVGQLISVGPSPTKRSSLRLRLESADKSEAKVVEVSPTVEKGIEVQTAEVSPKKESREELAVSIDKCKANPSKGLLAEGNGNEVQATEVLSAVGKAFEVQTTGVLSAVKVNGVQSTEVLPAVVEVIGGGRALRKRTLSDGECGGVDGKRQRQETEEAISETETSQLDISKDVSTLGNFSDSESQGPSQGPHSGPPEDSQCRLSPTPALAPTPSPVYPALVGCMDPVGAVLGLLCEEKAQRTIVGACFEKLGIVTVVDSSISAAELLEQMEAKERQVETLRAEIAIIRKQLKRKLIATPDGASEVKRRKI